MNSKRFRIAFSFAGEKRDFVSKVAAILAQRFGEVAILYDKFNEAEFAQWKLGLNLPDLYRDQSDLIAVLTLAALSHHPVAFTRGRAHTSLMAAPTLEPAPRVCSNCGGPYLVGMRCTSKQPPNDCEEVGSPHIHWGCTNCPSHWVEPTSGRCCSRRR
jgi:hypothetical protein